ARTDAEEGCVEANGVGEKAAFVYAFVHDRPAAVVRELADRIAAVEQQLPKLFGRAHATRKTAAHRHDRDRLVYSGRDGPRDRRRFGHTEQLRAAEASE